MSLRIIASGRLLLESGMSFNPAAAPFGRLILYLKQLGVLGWGALIVATLLIIPLVAVVSSVFVQGSVWEQLAETVLASYLVNTLWLLLGVACGVISMGVLSAWLIASYRFPGHAILQWALLLPLAMPAYVMAYAYTDALQFAGPVQTALREWTGWRAREYWFPEIRSIYGAAAMFSFALYPYVYLLARVAFLEQSRSALEAGRLAGYSAFGSFWRVALPLARPAIVAGSALALMETLADFGTVAYFALPTFTTGIFRAWFSYGDPVAAAQLASCLLAFVLIVLFLERRNRGAARYQLTGVRRPAHSHSLDGGKAMLATLACTAPVVLGFILPVGLLIDLALEERMHWSSRVLTLAVNSFSLAGVTAVAAILLALLLTYAGRMTRSPLVNLANRGVSLGYAAPGAVIAVGVLIPLGKLDNALAQWLHTHWGINIGLLLTGSIVALVYAYLVRYLSVALQTVDAGLTKITASMDDAARSLGLNVSAVLKRVHAPMLYGSLLSAGLLVFVDVMKELPATFAMRPFNFDTLAVEAYNLAKDERLSEAAVPALLIVLVGLLPLLFISRRLLNLSK
ncbi:MAG TPA: iron ABC transporter permease [Burkholderiales bacterium]|nr:iron ABC transporter permease [Burkholderiales bacterium]